MSAVAHEQCWRVLLRDRRGCLWWPIVSAVDEETVREKAEVLYPKSLVVAVNALHATAVPPDWHTGRSVPARGPAR